MNHNDLVKSASGWLKSKKGCSIVSTELVTGGSETPDAIGWNGSVSILIEAKASIADFKADQKKRFRAAGRGMGIYRYYIVPLELREKILLDLPEGWGLLYRTPYGRIVVERESGFFENDAHGEILFLSSVIRRIAMRSEPLKGINVRCYTFESGTTPKAELFIGIDQNEN